MAIVTYSDSPADLPVFYDTQILKWLLSIDGAVTADATLIHATGSVVSAGYYPYYEDTVTFFDLDIEGSFTYGPLGTVSGTATGITASLDGTVIVTISDMAADIARLWPTLLGSAAPDALVLSGDDTITGPVDGGYIQGHDGNDTIYGRGAYNGLFGDDGNDVIYGGDEGNNIYGGAGSDRLFGGDGNDYILGGFRPDLLSGGKGADRLLGGTGDDRVLGGNGADFLDGQNGNDRLVGGRGNDRMYGRLDNDTLLGGGGNDKLDGGAGDDTLTGGAGNDVFVFTSFKANGTNGMDTVTDFSDGDRLVFSGFADESLLTVTQVGDDVTIGLADNLVTLLDTTLAEVQAAIEVHRYYYF